MTWMVVALRIVEKRWAMTMVVRPCMRRSKACWIVLFGLAVEGGGGFVQEEDGGVFEEGAGDGDALALTTGEAASVLAGESIVAIGLLKDKLVGEGSFCGVLDFSNWGHLELGSGVSF